jgi:A/G-specific adenine glycosylase
LEQFPTIEALATADLDAVLKLWEGLGYYARARNLHAAACEVVQHSGGCVPATWDKLLRLPGVGQYTAGAIASIAFGERRPAVDGNVRRVLSRLYAIQEPIDEGRTRRRLRELASQLVPEDRSGEFNQALMDLGATICTPHNPACQLCPLDQVCSAHASGLQNTLPKRTPRKSIPHYNATAGVIWNSHERVLIAQRPHGGLLGGLWTFPGGRQKSGEDLEACLRRSIDETLGIEVRVGEPIVAVDHAYTHFRVTVYAFYCRHESREPQALGYSNWQWVDLNELERFALPKVHHEVLRALCQ